VEASFRQAIIAHLAPYIAWWVCKFALNIPAVSDGWQYAVRSVVCLGVFLAFRPWRWYPKLNLKNVPLGLGVGVFIFLVWVVPESQTVKTFSPSFYDLYQRFFVGIPILGSKREVVTPPPFAPETCGWALTLARLCGSAFVIAFIEEFFFRGFLYRFAIAWEKFTKVEHGHVDFPMFILVALTFAFEHNEWMAGLICGLAYGWLYIQSRDIWATGIAHMTTNFLLGLYVIKFQAHQFW
jgi:membrane protease YdiL (CAAX protease family)